MTQEEEQKVNELSQMDQMGQFVQTVTPGYGLFPATKEATSVPALMPDVSSPKVNP